MATDKVDPATLSLRATPRPVARLSRRSVGAIVVIVVGGVFGATLWSLRGSTRLLGSTPTELHNVDRIAHAEGLEQLPADYTKAPTPAPPPPLLGPPLPGDLGEPILRAGQAQRDLPMNAAPTVQDPAAEALRAERLARQRETEDAAKGGIFFRSTAEWTAATSTQASDRAADAASSPASTNTSTETARAVGGDKRSAKEAFIDRPAGDSASVSTHSLQLPASTYLVSAGTVIPAALVTGIRSDLPGTVLATATEDVRDSATGRYVLIPQGSRLVGQYDSQVTFGQRRILLVWNRLILPDASSLTLDRLTGVDASGYAGLEDQIDQHVAALLGGAALSTLIGIGAELAAPDRGNEQSQVVIATRQSVQDSVSQVGQELTRRNLDVQPTLTIRPGFPLRVLVNRDLVLRPYQPLFIEQATP